MKSYTICLTGLDSKKTVVIGGGRVASHKVEALLEAGARISLISPEITLELQMLADAGQIEAELRPYAKGDLAGAFLIIAATDEPEINQQVWQEALANGCLINVVDDPAHSNFTLPALVRRDELTIAISTGGSSPALARRLRERLERLIGPEYGILASLMAELRPEMVADFPPGEARLQAALRVIDSDILHIIEKQGRDAALSYGRARLHDQ